MNDRAILVVVLAFFLSGILPVHAATTNSPSLSAIQIFPKDNIWNTRVDTLPVDEKSDIYIQNLVNDTASYTGIRHYIRTAIPYNIVNLTQPRQYVAKFNHPAYSDNVAYPIPDNPLFEQGSNDHHMVIIDTDTGMLYELFAAERTADDSWKAGIGAVWDLNGYSFRKNNATPMWSADESGLPVFPGLVRYDEVSAGYINHSLRIAVPEMQYTWVWPARASSYVESIPELTHPPAGQRLRLKASYNISGFPPQAKVILQALKTYGGMVATNGGANVPVTIIGTPDTRWDYTDLSTLYNVNISDFEAVDVSSLMIDPNSAQARQLPTPTPTPTPAPTPAEVPPDPSDKGTPDFAIFIGCIGISSICCVAGYLKK